MKPEHTSDSERRERLAAEAERCAAEFEEMAESHALMQADCLRRAVELRQQANRLRTANLYEQITTGSFMR